MINVTTRMVRVDGLNIRRVTLFHEPSGASWVGYDFGNAKTTAKAELVEQVMRGLTSLPIDTTKLAQMLELAALYREVDGLQEGDG